MKNRRTLIFVVIGFVVAAAASWLAYFTFFSQPQTDKVLAELRKAPLLGQVMTDVPSVEQRLRQAIDDDQKNPLPGRSRAFETIVDVRKTYIVPGLQAASDEAALNTMSKRVAFATHLQSSDPSSCRQFAGGGLRDVNKLDKEGQRLFVEVLAATEAAYRSGRDAGVGSKPAMTAEEYTNLLRGTGFGDADFRKLDTPMTLSDAEVCTLEVRIDSAALKVPEDRRGAFARYVLAR